MFKKFQPFIKKNDAAPLKECIHDLIEAYRLKRKFSEAQILSSWENLMGKTISSRTTSILIRDKKLYVKISSAPLKKELSMGRSKILILLNQEFGENILEEVIFI